MYSAFGIAQNRENSKYCQTFINLLSNIAATSSQMAIKVFDHRVFGIVYEHLQS